MKRTSVAGLSLILLSAFSSFAGRKSDHEYPIPAASRINPEHLNEASRAAIACGADYLLTRAATNYMNLVVEPAVRRRVRQAYEVRYTKKIVEHPVYQWEYEDVMVAREGSLTGDRTLRKVKRAIPGSHKQVGTEKVERLVQDPKGEIVRKHPAVEMPEYWQHGFVGVNALALYALLKAGVPETDPVVAKIAEELRGIVLHFGAPDTTYDLAWLTAAFSNLKNEKFERPRTWMVNKILDGQITDGPGRGLWGPICVNTALLATMIGHESQLGAELAKAREQEKRRPDSPAVTRQIQAVESARENFIAQYRRVTQQGFRFEEITRPYYIIPRTDPEQTTAPGLYYYIYNQAVADLESTALAMLAIREAHDNGHLPEQTWRPETGEGRARKTLVPPDSTSRILARCAAAVAKLQRSDGAWDEANLHQPVAHFIPLNFRPLPKEDHFRLVSEVTPLSMARAYNIFFHAGQIVGMHAFRKYSSVLTDAQTAFRDGAEKYADNQLKLAPDRYLTPYNYFLELSGIQKASFGMTEDRRDIRARLAYRLLILQGADGAWGGDGYKVFHSTGLLAYWDNLWRRRHDEEQAKLPQDKRMPYDREYWWRRHTHWTSRSHGADSKAVSTSYAMLFLLDGLREPAAGFVKELPTVPFPLTLGPAMEFMKKNDRLPVTCIAVEPETPVAQAKALPIWVIDSRSPLENDRLVALLGAYLKGDGVLVVEAMSAASLQRTEAKLQTLLEGSELVPIPAEAAFLGDIGKADARGRALVSRSGRIAAIFVPPHAPYLVYRLMKHRLGQDYFDPEYARRTDGDHFAARVTAMHRLIGTPVPDPIETPVPEPAPATDREAMDERTEADHAPPEPPPAADEVW